MKTELERYKEALDTAFTEFEYFLAGHADCDRVVELANKKVNSILHPEPEYEEVEVVRWTWGEGFRTWGTQEEATDAAKEGTPVFKLTGTLRRPKPQKVERSVSVSGMVANGGIVYRDTGGSKTFFDHPETHDKKGIITFTWTEEGEGE